MLVLRCAKHVVAQSLHYVLWISGWSRGIGSWAALRGEGRFPVFATCPVVILAHSQTIADQGEKKDEHCEVHSSPRTTSTLHRRGLLKIHSGPLQPRPEWGGVLEPGGAGPRPEGR